MPEDSKPFIKTEPDTTLPREQQGDPDLRPTPEIDEEEQSPVELPRPKSPSSVLRMRH